MKEKDYFPPECIILHIEQSSYVCASTNVDTNASLEDFDIDLVEY